MLDRNGRPRILDFGVPRPEWLAMPLPHATDLEALAEAVRVLVTGTNKPDEETIAADPLMANVLAAIGGVLEHRNADIVGLHAALLAVARGTSGTVRGSTRLRSERRDPMARRPEPRSVLEPQHTKETLRSVPVSRAKPKPSPEAVEGNAPVAPVETPAQVSGLAAAPPPAPADPPHAEPKPRKSREQTRQTRADRKITPAASADRTAAQEPTVREPVPAVPEPVSAAASEPPPVIESSIPEAAPPEPERAPKPEPSGMESAPRMAPSPIREELPAITPRPARGKRSLPEHTGSNVRPVTDGRPRKLAHYRILGELGRDRIGALYRAIDERLDRPVVLKAIRAADLVLSDEINALRFAFRQAAQAAARVAHPNFATIYAFEALDAIDLVVMELVEGGTLRARLSLGERWTAIEAAKLMARVADTVAAAHASGIAHGHLSLANIKLRPDGRVKVLDLGIPKASTASSPFPQEASADAFREDVAALASITCQLIAGARRAELEGPEPGVGEGEIMLADPAQVWSHFGMLAPALGRGLGAQGESFANAAEFRDALLEVLQDRRRTPIAQPNESGAAIDEATRAEVLEEEGVAVSALYAGEGRGPTLVLPPDLAGMAPIPAEGSFVVMELPNRVERVRMLKDAYSSRLTSISRQKIAAGSIGLVLLVGALGLARYFMSGGASAEIPAGDARAASENVNPPAVSQNPPPPPDPGIAVALAAESTRAQTQRTEQTTERASDPPQRANDRRSNEPASQPGRSNNTPRSNNTTRPTNTRDRPMRTAQVNARPEGTIIRIESQTGQWTNSAELSVAERDSLVVLFSRAGYVSQQRVFRGNDISVQLQPDSVTVTFDSNVPAEVFFESSSGWRALGATSVTTRLPTGTHRIAFRPQDQAEWSQLHSFTTPGRSYRIQKLDFPTRGSVFITIPGSWANVSINGGDEHETPVGFDNLPIGRHIVRITRPGYETVIDTVLVRAGQRTTRQYQLRPRGNDDL
jgi:serine/threonine protein kinase